MAFGLGKIGDIAKKLATVARDTTPAYQVYKNRKKLGKTVNKVAGKVAKAHPIYQVGKAVVGRVKRNQSKTYATKRMLEKKQKIRAEKFAADKRRKAKRSPGAKKDPSRGRRPRKEGLRRSRKPGIRKGITGRTYSGKPMNRADVTKKVAEAMKKRKK